MENELGLGTQDRYCEHAATGIRAKETVLARVLGSDRLDQQE